MSAGGIPVRVRRAAGGARRRLSPPPHMACYAPLVQLYFFPNGDVRPCCVNDTYPLGNLGQERLVDIWNGVRRATLVDRLAHDDFSHGCSACAWELSVEGRATSFPGHFDVKARHLRRDPATAAWPRWMEFNLSNSCNLQCIQCNGDLSSSIRIHREGRAPLPKVYGDEFFEDLALFLPHLTEAQFAGGEPFLGAENYRAWELLAEVAPHVRCQVVTNATQWNRRVVEVLDRIPFSFCFSIDGITAETYESIRMGADFDEVLTNVDRFCGYARRNGTRLRWNFCLMPQNVHEFGDVLEFAEHRGIEVSVQVVHAPSSASIAALPPDELVEVHRRLCRQSDDVLARLELNAHVWRTEVDRIGAWAAASDPEAHLAAWGGGPPPPVEPPPPPPPVEYVLGLPVLGDGPVDRAEAVERLRAFDTGATVHEVVVDRSDTIVDCSPGVPEGLGCAREDLVGRPAEALRVASEARFGPLSGGDTLSRSDDEIDAVARYGDQELRAITVALRDEHGVAEHAAILFALGSAD
ncbi:MAG: SPASM domain-containing protein [Acidimicrobiales bacterium]|nr:SPASM domain-containing protein [Acidimicrobiales bacterium]